MMLRFSVVTVTLGLVAASTPKESRIAEVATADVVANAIKIAKLRSDADPGPTPAITCIIGHCMGKAAKCALDHDCRSGLACTAGCGTTNQTCIFQCTSDFENEVYDSLLRCMFSEHDCMRMPKGQTFDKWGSCRSVEKAAPVKEYLGKPLTPALSRDLLRRSGKEKGYWLVAMGLSKAYDCFDCQNVWFNTWEQDDTRLTYDAIYKIQKSDGTARWNYARYNASASFPEAGRLFLFAPDYGGLVHEEDWRILAIDERSPNEPEWIALYYCGSASGVKETYEGSCLVTPDGKMPADTAEVKKIHDAYAMAGVSPQCFPDSSAAACKGHPTPWDPPSFVV